jgi:hypothetical protein
MSPASGKRRMWSAFTATDDALSDLTDCLPENETADPARFEDEEDDSPTLEEIREYLA